jgi:hypothetical protein
VEGRLPHVWDEVLLRAAIEVNAALRKPHIVATKAATYFSDLAAHHVDILVVDADAALDFLLRCTQYAWACGGGGGGRAGDEEAAVARMVCALETLIVRLVAGIDYHPDEHERMYSRIMRLFFYTTRGSGAGGAAGSLYQQVVRSRPAETRTTEDEHRLAWNMVQVAGRNATQL